MCTCGAISTKDENGQSLILLGKTLDFYECSFWHGKVTCTNGNSILGLGAVPQIGINSGINKNGLGVLLSFLDYRGPFEKNKSSDIPQKWSGDDRALLNAQILAKCINVEEAIEFLYENVPKYPSMPGGNHMLADANGNIAVFEHCAGQMKHKYYTEQQFASRGNNGFLVIQDEQNKLSGDVQRDRNLRSENMADTLKKLITNNTSYDEALDNLKKVLGSHSQDADQIGSICIHNHVLPGARASTHVAMSTVTAVILDVVRKKMLYTIEAPCKNKWYELDFQHIVAK